MSRSISNPKLLYVYHLAQQMLKEEQLESQPMQLEQEEFI